MKRQQLRDILRVNHFVREGSPKIANTERALAAIIPVTADWPTSTIASNLRTLAREANRFADALEKNQ